jgi:predicted Zn-dependent protease with MMP-like domain
MVWEALDALPAAVRERLSNLAVVVEEAATASDYRLAGVRHGTLLGVYRGVPLTARTSSYGMVLPDRIVIFEAPLRQLARDDEHLRELVHHTVRHEIAHHFGISDERLRELGAY